MFSFLWPFLWYHILLALMKAWSALQVEDSIVIHGFCIQLRLKPLLTLYPAVCGS